MGARAGLGVQGFCGSLEPGCPHSPSEGLLSGPDSLLQLFLPSSGLRDLAFPPPVSPAAPKTSPTTFFHPGLPAHSAGPPWEGVMPFQAGTRWCSVVRLWNMPGLSAHP